MFVFVIFYFKKDRASFDLIAFFDGDRFYQPAYPGHDVGILVDLEGGVGLVVARDIALGGRPGGDRDGTLFPARAAGGGLHCPDGIRQLDSVFARGGRDMPGHPLGRLLLKFRKFFEFGGQLIQGGSRVSREAVGSLRCRAVAAAEESQYYQQQERRR